MSAMRQVSPLEFLVGVCCIIFCTEARCSVSLVLDFRVQKTPGKMPIVLNMRGLSWSCGCKSILPFAPSPVSFSLKRKGNYPGKLRVQIFPGVIFIRSKGTLPLTAW